MTTCPSLPEWEELVTGACDPARAQAMRRHAHGCTPCRRLLGDLERNQSLLGAVRNAVAAEAGPGPADQVGRHIGEFTITGVLGS
jgi:hypothetical protein